MGFPVLIIGESGSGKTYSIKNLNPEEVGIFSIEKTDCHLKNNLKLLKMQLINK